MTALWVVLAVIGGIILGGALVFFLVSFSLAMAVGSAFGWPVRPWWKFW